MVDSDDTSSQDLPPEADGDSMRVENDDEADDQENNSSDSEAQKALEDAAKQVQLVVLPLACVNEGKGAPLAMGIQRWWAQEFSRLETRAAAPVFTAMAEQQGRKVPALMVYRDPWTTERILEGIRRFPNAKRAIVADFKVGDSKIEMSCKVIEREEENIKELASLDFNASGEELPQQLFDAVQQLAAHNGHTLEQKSWEEHFGTNNRQAILSFLVGLGNLSALQGRCVPAGSDQLLGPLLDAIQREPQLDPAMDAIHAMVDILLSVQPDRGTIPLCMQALTIAAQRREKDGDAWHHLAALARKLGDLPTALHAFNQSFNLDPSDIGVTVSFIDALQESGDQENALKVAKFAVERGNEAPPVLGLLGRLLIDHDEFDSAEPFLRRAIEEGSIASAYGDLANVLWDRADENTDSGKEDRQEAMRLLESAIELPEISKSTLDMLLDLHEEENLERATELLLLSVKRHADNPAVLTAAANMYIDGENPEQSRPHLQKILELKDRSLDDDAFARRNLLTLDMENFDERYDEAVENIQSGDATKRKEAARFMREVIAQDDKFWQPHLMLGLSVRETEGEQAALNHLRNAVRLRPNDPEIHTLIAAILRKLGMPREAIEHVRALVSLKPREIEPVVQLASCMRDANLFDEARSVCDAALKMVPDHPEFKNILESLPPPKDKQN